MTTRLLLVLLVLLSATVTDGHDTWVQTNNNIIRTGDSIFVDLMLGNHGNEHRDFKIASKIDLDKCKLGVVLPSQQTFDLKDRTIDCGYAPKEGFWSAKFVPAKPGLYMVTHSLDTVHKTTRAIKSGKTFFVVSDSLDKVPTPGLGFDKPVGGNLELVPTVNLVAPMGPGIPIAVRLMYEGKPLPKTRVSFIPRGTALAEGFDEKHERTTNEDGIASFTPTEGNYILVVAHHAEPEQKGEGYDRTSYSATLTVYVPEVCPCCE